MYSGLRKLLLELLGPGGAHADFEKAVDAVAIQSRGIKPTNQPHTLWRLLEHMRIAQRDILDFSKDARHKSPKWPDEYWPSDDSPSNAAAWDTSVSQYKADRQSMIDLISDPKSDLLTAIPHSDGQTLAREAMLLADHTAYHLGQFILLRRLIGDWHGD